MSARQQYATCRGEDSELVHRVDKALAHLAVSDSQHSTSATNGDQTSIPDNKEDFNNDDDLVLAEGWRNNVLFEIKTNEPEEDHETLSMLVQDKFSDRPELVQWAQGYRSCEIGFGIQTLILSCRVNESIRMKEELAQDIAEAFDETFRSIDILQVQDYH
jgi:translation elongation factor EF-1beta